MSEQTVADVEAVAYLAALVGWNLKEVADKAGLSADELTAVLEEQVKLFKQNLAEGDQEWN